MINKKDVRVRIVHKDSDGAVIGSVYKPVEEYCRDEATAIKWLIGEIEHWMLNAPAANEADMKRAFMRIRHALLDRAGNMARLPDSIYINNEAIDSIKSSEMLAELVDRKAGEAK